MSKGLQWVIGIGVVLVVGVVILAGLAPYVLPRFGLAAAPPFAAPRFAGPLGIYGRHIPFRPGFPFGFGGRMPFLGFFGLARCIWPLLLAGLIVLAISLLSRRPAPYPYAPPMAQAPMAQAPMATAPASQMVCANCGQPLQAGWRHCPNCGTPVAQ